MSLLIESHRILDEYQSRKLFHASLAASQLLGVCALLCVVCWMGGYEDGYAWNENPDKEFHYHPTFMAIGPIFLLGEAILVYRTFRKESKRFTKLLHISIFSIVFVFGMTALKAVWDSHDYHRDPDGELSPLPNLYSLHSWMGIVIFVSFCLQYVGGFVTFFFPGLAMETRKSFLPFHQLFGILLMIGFTAAALMGISERAAWKHVFVFRIVCQVFKNIFMEPACWTRDKQLCGEQVLANLFGLFIIGYTSTVVFIVMNPRWKRVPLPEEESIQLMSNDDY